MDDIGAILQFLIIAGVFIYMTVFRKKVAAKVKEQQQSSPHGENFPFPVPEEQEETSLYQDQQRADYKEIMEEMRIESLSDIETMSDQFAVRSIMADTEVPGEIGVSEDVSGTEGNKIRLNDLELDKMIIYSELMNPKFKEY